MAGEHADEKNGAQRLEIRAYTIHHIVCFTLHENVIDTAVHHIDMGLCFETFPRILNTPSDQSCLFPAIGALHESMQIYGKTPPLTATLTTEHAM